MQKTENRDRPFVNFVLSAVSDPVLWYTVLIMSSIMNHYRSELMVVYGAATLVIAGLVYKLFDYIAKHKLIGTAAYIVLFMCFVYGSRLFIAEGRINYPISFLLWFLTPQDSLQYNKWYTLAMYMLFMIFMMSVIYYFTKVRYRIFMNFLIFIIPFALYGKEYEKMPTAFIMLLAIGYIVIMINCRQIADGEKTVIVKKSGLWKSAAAYVVIYASLAAMVPKPEVEADRRILEQMISADALTDRLDAALGVFRDSVSGEQFRSLNDQVIHYYAKSEEDLRLKTTTFSAYDYSKDSWTIDDNDSRFRYKTMYTPEEKNLLIKQAETDDILEAIALAAKTDEEFAAEYGLENFTLETLSSPEIKNVVIYTAFSGTAFAPVPTQLKELTATNYDGEIALIKSGLVYCVKNTFRANQIFSYDYCSESFFYDSANIELINSMSRDDYYNMLDDAAKALETVDEEASELLINSRLDVMTDENCLDYGGSKKIYELAQELTAGLESDYEKAKAIERYFAENDFYYDMEYIKDSGDNAETFIFESKRGVCYEFATAMVLLSRAAGIPARYAEGYSMTERYDAELFETNYLIRARAAHGFPELYIRGVGWVSFEPTISTLAPDSAQANASSKLASAGVFLLITALIFLLMVKLLPILIHIIFVKRAQRLKPEAAAVAIMRRMYSLYRIEKFLTVHEAAEKIKTVSGADVEYAAELFERAAYGRQTITESEKEKALSEYICAYKALKEQKKRKNKRVLETT